MHRETLSEVAAQPDRLAASETTDPLLNTTRWGKRWCFFGVLSRSVLEALE
jgi:hypothetical protein